ncbi:hypothetical protein LOC54_07640 [Acetobacter sp. AN02]|uniref:hypothetical protein n=1 Tax=Acetobacter sp. AN02 TaxID=2894186 RepID=UPI002434173C|nr:hypothetical protein [Acetobacter sp. AN02]MDG6094980.1 hypothetical protein [Acetobacter sp. AN02]
MMKSLRFLLPVLPGLFAAPAALADDAQTAPFVTPSVDSEVLYESPSPQGGAPVRLRTRWQVAGLLKRDDPEGSAVYMITSWKARTLTVVDTLHHRRSTMPVPGGEIVLPGQPAKGNFIKLGTQTVAGESCDTWRTSDRDGHQSDVCYTSDGILLRVDQNGTTVVRAVQVTRAPQPDAIFAMPEGFRDTAPAGRSG